jgi:hypothetical protein
MLEAEVDLLTISKLLGHHLYAIASSVRFECPATVVSRKSSTKVRFLRYKNPLTGSDPIEAFKLEKRQQRFQA